MLKRLAAGRPEKAMVVTGLRGVGKTVLLRSYEDQADALGWRAVSGLIAFQGVARV